MYLPSLHKFTKNLEQKNYQKRMIVGENVFRLSIPFETWDNVTTTKNVQRWITKNKHKIISHFPWGTILKEDSILPHMITDHLCEFCNEPCSSFKMKCRHMEKCRPPIIEHTTTTPPQEPQFTIPIVNQQVAQQNVYIQNNIQIRGLGDENPNWLTSKLLYQVIGDIGKAIPRLMEKKHFNDDFPENKNLKVFNPRDINKRLQVFENGRWHIKDSKQTFYRVLVDIYDVLSDALSSVNEENEEDKELSEDMKNLRRSERFLKKVQKIRPIWEDFVKRYQDEDKLLMEEYWEDLKTLLLDRQIAIEQGFDC